MQCSPSLGWSLGYRASVLHAGIAWVHQHRWACPQHVAQARSTCRAASPPCPPTCPRMVSPYLPAHLLAPAQALPAYPPAQRQPTPLLPTLPTPAGTPRASSCCAATRGFWSMSRAIPGRPTSTKCELAPCLPPPPVPLAGWACRMVGTLHTSTCPQTQGLPAHACTRSAANKMEEEQDGGNAALMAQSDSASMLESVNEKTSAVVVINTEGGCCCLAVASEEFVWQRWVVVVALWEPHGLALTRVRPVGSARPWRR